MRGGIAPYVSTSFSVEIKDEAVYLSQGGIAREVIMITMAVLYGSENVTPKGMRKVELARCTGPSSHARRKPYRPTGMAISSVGSDRIRP